MSADERLVVSDHAPHRFIELGLTPVTLHAAALDKHPAQRWWARINCIQGKALSLQGLNVYQPLTEQLQP